MRSIRARIKIMVLEVTLTSEGERRTPGEIMARQSDQALLLKGNASAVPAGHYDLMIMII